MLYCMAVEGNLDTNTQQNGDGMSIEIAYEYHTTVVYNEETHHFIHCHGDFDLNAEVQYLDGFDSSGTQRAEYLSDICKDEDPGDWLEAAPILFNWAEKNNLLILKVSSL